MSTPTTADELALSATPAPPVYLPTGPTFGQVLLLLLLLLVARGIRAQAEANPALSVPPQVPTLPRATMPARTTRLLAVGCWPRAVRPQGRAREAAV